MYKTNCTANNRNIFYYNLNIQGPPVEAKETLTEKICNLVLDLEKDYRTFPFNRNSHPNLYGEYYQGVISIIKNQIMDNSNFLEACESFDEFLKQNQIESQLKIDRQVRNVEQNFDETIEKSENRENFFFNPGSQQRNYVNQYSGFNNSPTIVQQLTQSCTYINRPVLVQSCMTNFGYQWKIVPRAFIPPKTISDPNEVIEISSDEDESSNVHDYHEKVVVECNQELEGPFTSQTSINIVKNEFDDSEYEAVISGKNILNSSLNWTNKLSEKRLETTQNDLEVKIVTENENQSQHDRFVEFEGKLENKQKKIDDKQDCEVVLIKVGEENEKNNISAVKNGNFDERNDDNSMPQTDENSNEMKGSTAFKAIEDPLETDIPPEIDDNNNENDEIEHDLSHKLGPNLNNNPDQNKEETVVDDLEIRENTNFDKLDKNVDLNGSEKIIQEKNTIILKNRETICINSSTETKLPSKTDIATAEIYQKELPNMDNMEDKSTSKIEVLDKIKTETTENFDILNIETTETIEKKVIEKRDADTQVTTRDIRVTTKRAIIRKCAVPNPLCMLGGHLNFVSNPFSMIRKKYAINPMGRNNIIRRKLFLRLMKTKMTVIRNFHNFGYKKPSTLKALVLLEDIPRINEIQKEKAPKNRLQLEVVKTYNLRPRTSKGNKESPSKSPEIPDATQKTDSNILVQEKAPKKSSSKSPKNPPKKKTVPDVTRKNDSTISVQEKTPKESPSKRPKNLRENGKTSVQKTIAKEARPRSSKTPQRKRKIGNITLNHDPNILAEESAPKAKRQRHSLPINWTIPYDLRPRKCLQLKF